MSADDIRIDYDVPIPSRIGKGRTSQFPFDGLDRHGASFFVPLKGRRALSLRTNLCQRARKRGFSLVTESVTENGVEGVRVWRVDGEPKAETAKAAPSTDSPTQAAKPPPPVAVATRDARDLVFAPASTDETPIQRRERRIREGKRDPNDFRPRPRRGDPPAEL